MKPITWGSTPMNRMDRLGSHLSGTEQPCAIAPGAHGTPFRADNLAFCAARRVRVEEQGQLVEQIHPDLSVEPRELIAAGDVRPLEFRFQDGWVEHGQEGIPDREVSPLSAEQRESWRARNLRRAIRLSDSSSIAQQLLLRARKQLEKVRNSTPARRSGDCTRYRTCASHHAPAGGGR